MTSRFVTTIKVDIDPRDRQRAMEEVEDLVLRYGFPPQPHQEKAFKAEVDRIVKTYAECIDLRIV